MRFDVIVHRFPGFYEWKLEMLKVVKKGAYRLLLVDKEVDELHHYIEQRNAALIAKYLTGKYVLEVGCGRGSFLAGLVRDRGCRCVGVDASGEMIKAATTENPGPDYYVMDGADLKFEDQSFDVVLFNYVLHHVEKLDETLAEAKRVGKKVIFYESCACKSTPAKQLSKLYWKLTDGGYEYLTLDEWKDRFQLPVLDEIEGAGLVRYGMCVLGKAEHGQSPSA
jgi:ubiquinone/menaquinone biosynthesis C-methylase UbiE